MAKRNLILFPHRVAPEKQPEIFADLAKALPQYKFVMCQEQQLSKDEYHTLLGKSKMVFSANLQETLGISMYEGAVVGAMPIVPDRLSYSEMYDESYRYPSEWTESFDSYLKYKPNLVNLIKHRMDNYDTTSAKLPAQVRFLHDNFFSANKLLEHLL